MQATWIVRQRRWLRQTENTCNSTCTTLPDRRIDYQRATYAWTEHAQSRQVARTAAEGFSQELCAVGLVDNEWCVQKRMSQPCGRDQTSGLWMEYKRPSG